MKNLDALFLISYGLYIVSSVDKKGKINGFVGNALTQVNSEPPTFALVVSKNNLTHTYIEESNLYSISILSIDTPLSLIGLFGFKSGRNVEKFKGINYKLAENGVPYLTDFSLGYIVCETFNKIDMGSHTIFLSSLLDCDIIKDGEPMTYLYYRNVKKGTVSKNAPTFLKNTSLKMEERMQKYVCKVCGYVYDPAVGDPDSGISPGTAFNDLPDSWVCPVCGAGKDQFELQ